MVWLQQQNMLTHRDVDTQRKRDMCYRPRAGRVEEEVRQGRAVELIAQKRLLDLHMRSQVCARCCLMPCTAIEHASCQLLLPKALPAQSWEACSHCDYIQVYTKSLTTQLQTQWRDKTCPART